MNISPQIEMMLVERDPDFARHIALRSISRRLEEAAPRPARKRKRRPGLAEQVKLALAAGLDVRSANVTADGVLLTFGEAEAPAPLDVVEIETPEQLRRLI